MSDKNPIHLWNWVGYFLLVCILIMIGGVILYEWKWLLWIALLLLLFYVVMRCTINRKTGTVECNPLFHTLIKKKTATATKKKIKKNEKKIV